MFDLPGYKRTCRIDVNAASGCDSDKALQFYLKCESKTATCDELANPGPFTKLDRLIVSACSKVIRDKGGEFASRIGRMQDTAAEKGTSVSGLQMQWLIFQEFKGDETCTTSFAIEDILRIHCAGWKDVPRFLGEFDDVMARTDSAPLDPTLVKTRLVNELRPIPQFKDDFVIWDRMPVAERRYSWLRTAVDTVIMTKRHEDYRKQEVAGPTARATPALDSVPEVKLKAKPKAKSGAKLTASALAAHDNAATKVCFAMRDRGACTAEDCPYPHKPSDIAAAKSAAGSSTGKSEKVFKGKGKG